MPWNFFGCQFLNGTHSTRYLNNFETFVKGIFFVPMANETVKQGSTSNASSLNIKGMQFENG